MDEEPAVEMMAMMMRIGGGVEARPRKTMTAKMSDPPGMHRGARVQTSGVEAAMTSTMTSTVAAMASANLGGDTGTGFSRWRRSGTDQ